MSKYIDITRPTRKEAIEAAFKCNAGKQVYVWHDGTYWRCTTWNAFEHSKVMSLCIPCDVDLNPEPWFE